MTLLSDGSIIIVGQQTLANSLDSRALIAKYTSAGSLDSSFNGGYHALDVDSTNNDNRDQLFDVALATDGTIYASGTSQSGTTDLQVLVSLNPSGTLNSQFNSNGIGLYDFGKSSDSPALTIDSNQKPLLVGLANNTSDGGTDVFIARFATDGPIDPLFNNGNAFITSYGLSDDVSLIIHLNSSSLLIAGDYQASQFNAQAWYMHKLTLIEN